MLMIPTDSIQCGVFLTRVVSYHFVLYFVIDAYRQGVSNQNVIIVYQLISLSMNIALKTLKYENYTFLLPYQLYNLLCRLQICRSKIYNSVYAAFQ